MKKALFARGFIGSLSLVGVIGAIGCSADALDEGAAGEGEIGVSEQALTTVASVQSLANAVAPGGGGITDPVARHGAASCKFKLEGVDLMLIHGGFEPLNGLGLDESYIYNPSANTWTKVEAITDMVGSQFDNQERGLGQMIPLDDDDATENNTVCLYAGGKSALSGGSVRTATFKVTLNSATSVTWTKVDDLNEGRVLGGLMRCGNGTGASAKALMVGGATDVDLASPIDSANSIEIWDGVNWTAADAVTPNEKLTPRVSAFGYAETDSHRKFAIAGGHDGNGAVPDLQTFTVNDTCTAVTKQSTGALRNVANSANQARFGSVARFAPGTSKLLVVAGGSDTALLNHAEQYTPTFTGTAFTRDLVITDLATARFPTPSANPSHTVSGNSRPQFVAVGGEVHSASNFLVQAPIDDVQEFLYNPGTAQWTHGTDVTFTARSLSAVEYLPSASKYFATTGLIDDSPFTLTTITESIQ